MLEVAESKNQKIRRDLVFLMNYQKHLLPNTNIWKYCLKEGIQENISQINQKCKIYSTWTQYDYQGCVIAQRINVSLKYGKFNHNDQISQPIRKILPTMKLYETSWFKFTNFEDHQTYWIKHTGCYYQLTINKIFFMNDELFISKQKVYQQNHQLAKECFKEGNYLLAMNTFMMLVNITEGFPKKNNYKPNELMTMRNWNIKSKQNFIRCFIKLNKFDKKQQQLASNYTKQLLLISDDEINNYLRSAYLLKMRYLNDSLIIAYKAYQFTHSKDCADLITLIKKSISQKNHKKLK